jgi:hypothetical protein
LSMPAYLLRLGAEVGRKPWATIKVPHWFARPMSHLLDVFHFSPMSFGHLELMMRDNVPAVNRLALLIARTPKEIGIDEACESPYPSSKHAML